jgi:hypothetical protein
MQLTSINDLLLHKCKHLLELHRRNIKPTTLRISLKNLPNRIDRCHEHKQLSEAGTRGTGHVAEFDVRFEALLQDFFFRGKEPGRGAEDVDTVGDA